MVERHHINDPWGSVGHQRAVVTTQGHNSQFPIHNSASEASEGVLWVVEAAGDEVFEELGVAAGDRVILDPPTTLADGLKVRVRETDAGSRPAAASAPGSR